MCPGLAVVHALDPEIGRQYGGVVPEAYRLLRVTLVLLSQLGVAGFRQNV